MFADTVCVIPSVYREQRHMLQPVLCGEESRSRNAADLARLTFGLECRVCERQIVVGK